MATEYTPNYNLDLYASADKPNLRDQYNGAMGKIDAALKTMAGDVTNANANVLTMKTAVDKATSDITALTSTVETHSTQITDAAKEANDALTLAQTNETDIASTQADVTSLTTRVGEAETKLTATANTANSNYQDVHNLQSDMRSANSSISANTSQINTIKSQLNEAPKNAVNNYSAGITAAMCTAYERNGIVCINIKNVTNTRSTPGRIDLFQLAINYYPTNDLTAACVGLGGSNDGYNALVKVTSNGQVYLNTIDCPQNAQIFGALAYCCKHPAVNG